MTGGENDRRILVIGGGLAGAAFALHLLREHGDLLATLDIVEPRAVLGSGLAYSTEDPAHRVNVAATRMSPFADAPDDFDAWLRQRGIPDADPAAAAPPAGLFPQRAEYGRYVADRLRDAAARAPALRFRHWQHRAVSVRREAEGFHVALDDGTALHAGLLVLAVGHLPPGLPGPLRPLLGDTRLIANPWDARALERLPRDARVLVVGTGLTGCDVVSSLRRRGHAGPILQVSRRGLLPRPRTRLPVQASGNFAAAPSRSATALLRRVRAQIAAETARGRPWENVIAALREQAGTVWGALPVPERRRVLRHLRAYWDVHRFQCAPQIDALVRDEMASGGLEVRAAALEAIRAGTDGIAVRLRPRGAPAGCAVERCVDAVVNCTGPDHAGITTGHPVLRELVEHGTLRADPCRLGIDVDGESRALDAAGHAQPDLLVAGPLARGTFGELMGLPQMSEQPRQLATLVAARLRAAVVAV